MSAPPERWRWLLLGGTYVLLVGTGLLAGYRLADFAMIDVRPSNEPEIHAMVMAVVALYVVAAALPFVPGAEIGFGLILALGPRIIPLVYLAMVAALLLAFLIGRFVPLRACAAVFDFARLRRARDLVLRLEPLGQQERLSLLVGQASTRGLPFLLRYRYLALALAINLPGNTVIGGGGGLALAAGMSGLYRPLPFAATMALAVAPLPLAILLSGELPGR